MSEIKAIRARIPASARLDDVGEVTLLDRYSRERPIFCEMVVRKWFDRYSGIASRSSTVPLLDRTFMEDSTMLSLYKVARVIPVCGVMLGAAVIALPVHSNEYSHRIEYSYGFLGGNVGTVPSFHPLSQSTTAVRSAGPIDRSFSQQLSLPGPGDSSGRVALSGFADFESRRFGTSARASAGTNPYDPDVPPPSPQIYDARGRIDTIVDDVVRIFSPSLRPGDPLQFSIAPGRLDGELFVPPGNGSNGSGVAAVQLSFGLLGFQLEGIRIGQSGNRINARTFEQILRTSDAGPNPLVLGRPIAPTDDNAGGTPRSTFAVLNGEIYGFELRLTSTVQSVGWSFPPENPPVALSRSTFDSTYYYNGLTDFRDGSGNPLTDITFISTAGSGFDWVSQEQPMTAVVPVPESALLLLSGLALLGSRAVRRPSHPENA